MDEGNSFRAQAQEVSYELHTLGWKAFQTLCGSILSEVLGQTYETFFDSNDGGRDGAFRGTWTPQQGELLSGSFTVQCKFTASPDKHLGLVDLSEEIQKAERLAAQGLAENYLLFANHKLTGIAAERVAERFQRIPGLKQFRVFGKERISQFIRDSGRLRMLVPGVYGLGDLSQILDERAYAQAREILSSMGDDLVKFVVTDAYRKSAEALSDPGFVLLLGEPACGKSTIAAALSMAALDNWSSSTLKLRHPDEFVQHYNPHEPRQMFWIDDAFGATQLDWHAANAWNQVFPHMRAALKKGARFILTSRNYIFRLAQQYLKASAFPLLTESQVIIQVEELRPLERKQILYNHIRLGNQPLEAKAAMKPFLEEVASHPKFSPEIARRLGDTAFTKRVGFTRGGLLHFVQHPMELLREVLASLDAGGKAAIALVFMKGGSLPSPLQLGIEDERAMVLFGASLAHVREALNSLNGSLLLLQTSGGQVCWRFKHPTVRDAFAQIVAEDRELMDVYLAGTPVEKLFSEIVCGDAGSQGAKVIVPEDRYELVLRRIRTIDMSDGNNRRQLHHFLGYRCSKSFLKAFLAEHPSFVRSLSLNGALSSSSEAAVVTTLYEEELLSEEERLRFVAEVSDFALSTVDAGFLDLRVRNLFTLDEWDALLSQVRNELLPNLSSEIETWHSDCTEDTDPEEHFYPLKEALKDLKREFVEDSLAAEQISDAISTVEEIVREIKAEQRPEEEDDPFRGLSSEKPSALQDRSIFEDVDQ